MPGPSRRERRSHRSHVRWIVAAVIVALLVVGGIAAALAIGGGSNDDKDQASSTGTTRAGSMTTTADGDTAPTTRERPATTAGPPGGPCKAADLTPAPSGSTVRGPNQVSVVALENTGGRQCTMNGFPTLVLLGPNDAKLTATVTQGGGGVPPQLTAQEVRLDPGARASFLMSWNPITDPCLDVRAIDITLPGDSKSKDVATSVNVCGGGAVNISAIQPGVVSP